MGAVPKCVLKHNLTSSILPDVRQMTDEALLEAHSDLQGCPDGWDLQAGRAIRAEHDRRFRHEPSYGAAILKGAEQVALEAPRHQAFDVSHTQSVALPETSWFGSAWFERAGGEQCIQVIDANDSGKPDDGDTCIARNGRSYFAARFVGSQLGVFLAGKTCSNPVQWERFAKTKDPCAKTYRDDDASMPWNQDNTGTTFEVHRPGGPERLAMEVGTSTYQYGSRVKEQVEEVTGSIEENPVAFGAGVVVVIGGMIVAPEYTIPALEAVGTVGAAGGTGYLVYDRASGLYQLMQDGDIEKYQENVGKDDVVAGLAMLGGGPALRGVTVTQGAKALFLAPTRALEGAGSALNGLAAASARAAGSGDALLEIPLMNITPTQGVVFQNTVQRYLNMFRAGKSAEPPVVDFFGGRVYVADGHHRLYGSYLANPRGTVRVKIYDRAADPEGMVPTYAERATSWDRIVVR